MPARFRRRLTLGAALVLLASVGLAGAQGVSEQQIIDALKSKPLTRGLGTTPSPADTARQAKEQRFIDSLRNRQTRSLTMEERQEIITIVKEKPSIDLEINFDYNSAVITKTGLPGVTALGNAMSNADLRDSTFVLAGHTDARGGDAFNQDLSERRADAIKSYLVETHKIPAANLVTVGYGKSQLKDKAHPEAAENRRVQVVNMAKSATAGK